MTTRSLATGFLLHVFALAATILCCVCCGRPFAQETHQAHVQGLRQGESARESSELFPGAIPTDARDRETHVVTQIMDGVTLRPLPGAMLEAFAEKDQPYPMQWPPVRRAVADKDGWARLRIDDIHKKYDWIIIKAEGYAAIAQMDMPDARIDLYPGVDIPVELRDGFDRPVAGARLGLILGCGHTPDVRVVHTDKHGRATLPCIEPERGDLWCVAPGFKAREDYLEVPDWRPGDPPRILRLIGGWVARGRVLDHGGKPTKGVLLGAFHVHRGPWTMSDDRGHFVLPGLEHLDEMRIISKAGGQKDWQFASCAPPGFDMTIRLPAPGEEAPEPDLTSEVHVFEEGNGKPLSEITVTAVRDGDSYTSSNPTDEDGLAELQLFEGKYTVLAGGSLEPFAQVRARLLVRPSATGAGKLRLELPRNPTLRLVPKGFPSGALAALAENQISIYLVTEDGEREVTEEVRGNASIPVPGLGSYLFRLESWDRTRLVRPPQAMPGKKPIVLAWYRPHRVKVRLVDPEGRPAKGRAIISSYPEWESHAAQKEPATELSIKTLCAGGRYYLIAEPLDTDSLQTAIVEIQLPMGEGKEIDSGTVAFPRAKVPLVRIVHGDGSPAANAKVHLESIGVSFICHTDDSGTVEERQLRMEGGSISVSDPEDYRLPFRTRLQGRRPWSLVWPDAGLRLELGDEKGKPLERFTVLVAGEMVCGGGERFEFRGLNRGRHQVVVTAVGYRACILSLDLEKNELRDLRIKLNPVNPSKRGR